MGQTQLTFINRSNQGDQNIVIYQPNEASMGSYNEVPIAWKVIENCGVNESHSFSFDSDLELAIGDSFGNYGQPAEVVEGKILEIVRGNFVEELRLMNKMTNNPYEFGVRNSLRDGSFTVSCFRSERVLATTDYIFPKEEALFRFSNTIFISAVPGAEEGWKLDISQLEDDPARFDLTAIGSADIVMTGGGEEPLQFSIENVEREKFTGFPSFGPPPGWGE